jgi:hypothetical protein
LAVDRGRKGFGYLNIEIEAEFYPPDGVISHTFVAAARMDHAFLRPANMV